MCSRTLTRGACTWSIADHRHRPAASAPRAASAANCSGRHADHDLGQQRGEPRLELDRRGRSRRACARSQLGEVGGGQLVGAVLQQPGEQQVARLEQREVLLVLDLGGRQQPGGLQVEQGRGDDEELGRLAEVPRRQRRRDVGDELVGDLRQRDLGDVELAPADQAEQQVERALEVGQPDAERAVVGAGVGASAAPATARCSAPRSRRHPRPTTSGLVDRVSRSRRTRIDASPFASRSASTTAIASRTMPPAVDGQAVLAAQRAAAPSRARAAPPARSRR